MSEKNICLEDEGKGIEEESQQFCYFWTLSIVLVKGEKWNRRLHKSIQLYISSIDDVNTIHIKYRI